MADIKAYGVDWAVYQGTQGIWGQRKDSFSICQIGGVNVNGIYDQHTYNSQIEATVKAGKRAHTYIWYEVGGSTERAEQVLDYFLPKIKAPKGSIVALDYEDGASGNIANNTNAIIYGMDRIAAAGYTPMYYSYKPYTLQYVDYKKIIAKYPNSLWIAAYPDYNVRTEPLWSIFPSMDGIAIWQFTSTYKAGGLDGNVDLTGITFSGYDGKHVAKPKEDGDDFFMNAEPKIKYDRVGYAWVTNKSGAQLFEDEKLTKKINRKLDYKSTWSVAAITDLAVSVGGYISKSDVVLKLNPFYGKKNINGAVVEVIAERTFLQAKPEKNQAGTTHLKKGSRYKAFEVKDGYIRLGSSTQWVDADKVRLLLNRNENLK